MLEELNLEKNFEKVKKLLIVIEKDFKLGDLNTRVLLSSFLFKNFRGYFLLNENDELYKLSKDITEYLIQKKYKKVFEVYDIYFEKFSEWRKNDIEMMKSEISAASEQLSDMKVDGDDLDDAEKQWNNGLAMNIKNMKTSEKLLNVYGKSPPSSRK